MSTYGELSGLSFLKGQSLEDVCRENPDKSREHVQELLEEGVEQGVLARYELQGIRFYMTK